MASVNRVILVGNLGADPDSKFFPSGDPVTTLRLATTDRWKDKASGETKEATEWHRVVYTGRLAEVCNEYLKKGASIYVEGSLRTRKYTDAAGVEKYATDIRGEVMQMLGGKSGGEGSGGGRDANNSTTRQQRPAPAPQNQKAPVDPGDDVPF